MPTLIKANPMPGLALAMLLNSKSHVPKHFGLERHKNNGIYCGTRRSRGICCAVQCSAGNSRRLLWLLLRNSFDDRLKGAPKSRGAPTTKTVGKDASNCGKRIAGSLKWKSNKRASGLAAYCAGRLPNGQPKITRFSSTSGGKADIAGDKQNVHF